MSEEQHVYLCHMFKLNINEFFIKTAASKMNKFRLYMDKYLLRVHAQVGRPSWYRDTSFCEFNEIFLNSTGNLECTERNAAVYKVRQMIQV